MIVKLYWPEQSRERKLDILKKVQAVAEKNPDVNGHILTMVRFHKFGEASTVSIRKILCSPSNVFYLCKPRSSRGPGNRTSAALVTSSWLALTDANMK